MVLTRPFHVRLHLFAFTNIAHPHASNSIVIITSIIVAASAAAISSKFDTFSHVGGIIGSSISAAFLLLLGIANAYIVFLILRQLRKLLRAQREEGDAAVAQFRLEGAGFFFRIFKRLFKLIDRSVYVLS